MHFVELVVIITEILEGHAQRNSAPFFEQLPSLFLQEHEQAFLGCVMLCECLLDLIL